MNCCCAAGADDVAAVDDGGGVWQSNQSFRLAKDDWAPNLVVLTDCSTLH